MLTGKYWLLKDGEVVDTSATEHAVLAREKILGLEPGDPLRVASPFYQLTAKDFDRLVDRRPHQMELYDIAAERMVRGHDPRWIFIEQYDAIRIAKDGFWCWNFDQGVRDRIRLAEKYWKAQAKLQHGDMLCLTSMQEKLYFEIPVHLIRDGKVSLSELRKFKVDTVNSLIP